MMWKRGILNDKPFWMKILVFIAIEFVCMCLGSFIGVFSLQGLFGISPFAIEKLTSDPLSLEHGLGALQFLQFMQAAPMFVLGPLVFAYWCSSEERPFIGREIENKWLFVSVALVISFVLSPFITVLAVYNESLHLPVSMAGIEAWMRTSEDTAKHLTDAFLSSTNFGDLLINVFIVGILAGVGEELFFRGVLQKLLADRIRNTHIAILITAVLFSAIHMQFFGFIPRLGLGILLGYLYHWSGSIWVPILAHSMNNSTAVIATYLFKQGSISLNPDDETLLPWSTILTATALASALLYLLYRNRKLEGIWQD